MPGLHPPAGAELPGIMDRLGGDTGMKQGLAISIFSGAGGLDVGVDQAGFRTICAIEKDPHCTDTLRANAKRGKLIVELDVRAIDPAGLMGALGLSRGELSLLHAGPPCQPFSQAGKKKGIHDERGPLIFEVARFAEAALPEAILIEQVDGILKSGGVIEELLKRLKKLNYGVGLRVMNAADAGVPQIRRRLIITAMQNQNPALQMSISKPPPTVADAIRDLPKPVSAEGEDASIENHIDKTPLRDRERISFVGEGSWLAKEKSAPPDIRRNLTRKDTTKFRRLAWNEPSLTLRCGEIFYHPRENRYLTPREYMRIQGFLDNYVLRGPIRGRTGQVTNLDQHRQVANSVPPPLAKRAAQAIKSQLCQ